MCPQLFFLFLFHNVFCLPLLPKKSPMPGCLIRKLYLPVKAKNDDTKLCFVLKKMLWQLKSILFLGDLICVNISQLDLTTLKSQDYVIEVQQEISVFLDFCYAPVGFFFCSIQLSSYSHSLFFSSSSSSSFFFTMKQSKLYIYRYIYIG